jgi:hypothetical protein
MNDVECDLDAAVDRLRRHIRFREQAEKEDAAEV